MQIKLQPYIKGSAHEIGFKDDLSQGCLWMLEQFYLRTEGQQMLNVMAVNAVSLLQTQAIRMAVYA